MKTITARAIAAKAAEQMAKREIDRRDSLPVVLAKSVKIPGGSMPAEFREAEKNGTFVAFKESGLCMGKTKFSARAVILDNDSNIQQESPHPFNVILPSKQLEMTLTESFIEEIPAAISKLSNRIGDYMHSVDTFNVVKLSIRDKKMYAETFYKRLVSAVYHSLMEFCGFKETHTGNGQIDNAVNWIPPESVKGMVYTNTLIFIERMWNINAVSRENDNSIVMVTYRNMFTDYDGIQRPWIDLLRDRLKMKMQMHNSGIETILDYIQEMWCTTPGTEIPDDRLQSFLSAKSHLAMVSTDYEEPEDHSGIPDGYVFSMNEGSSSEKNEEESEATGVVEIENEDEDEDEDDEDLNEVEFLSVEVYFEDDYDIIRINSEDAFGSISIPIYTKLSEVGNNYIPSQVSDLNGIWDWLIHMVPDMMFKTKTPEKYLEINNVPHEEDQMHVVIMDESDGEYTMGIYRLVGVFIIDEDGDRIPCWDMDESELLFKINNVIREDIGTTRMTHLGRSLTMADFIHEEEYITSLLIESDDEDEDEGNNDCECDCPHEHAVSMNTDGMNEIQMAAFLALTGDAPKPETKVDIPAPPTELPIVEAVVQEIIVSTEVTPKDSVQPEVNSEDSDTKIPDYEESFDMAIPEPDPEPQEDPIEVISDKQPINEAERVLPGDGMLQPVRRRDKHVRDREKNRDRELGRFEDGGMDRSR